MKFISIVICNSLVPYACLFELVLYVPVNKFSVMSGRFLGGISTKQRIKFAYDLQFSMLIIKSENIRGFVSKNSF